MVRVKRGVTQRRKHKKILKLTRGYKGGRSKLFREAKRAHMKAGLHAYEHRRLKKRDFRALWIVRLNAALVEAGYKYSRFIFNLTSKNIKLDRKVLADLALHNPNVFAKVVEKVMA